MSRGGEQPIRFGRDYTREHFEDFFAGTYAANERQRRFESDDPFEFGFTEIPMPRDPTLNLDDEPVFGAPANNTYGVFRAPRTRDEYEAWAGIRRPRSPAYDMIPFMTRPPPFVPPPPVDDRRQLYFRSLRNVPIRRDQSDLVRHHQRRIANSEVWVPVHSYRRRKPDIIPPPHGDEGIVL